MENFYLVTGTDEDGNLLVNVNAFRLLIATYLLGQMINTDAHTKNGESPKERKVKAAFEYADLLMKG